MERDASSPQYKFLLFIVYGTFRVMMDANRKWPVNNEVNAQGKQETSEDGRVAFVTSHSE